MFKLISNLLTLNVALGSKLRSIQAFDEGMDLHGQGNFREALPLMQEAALI